MKTQTSAGFRDPASARGVETVEVPEDRDGQRVDNFLTGRLKGVPKSHVYRLLRTGQVRVNGKRAKPDHRLAAGDAVRIPPVRVAERPESGPPPAAQSARVEAAILSAATMLRHTLDLPEAADRIEAAVTSALKGGARTPDLGGTATTADVGAAVLAAID